KKIGMIQRRLAWPLHNDDTLSRSRRATGLNIDFTHLFPIFHRYCSASEDMADRLQACGTESIKLGIFIHTHT
ncbi:hypothetical protein PHLGIDRAFT_76982, partial [Phlebiopsis gigantea 11061_1 CR5-6]